MLQRCLGFVSHICPFNPDSVDLHCLDVNFPKFKTSGEVGEVG